MKNRTYYEGKPYLKFEKYPDYQGRTKLNKVHVDLGFCKLVSRVSNMRFNDNLLRKLATQQNVQLRSRVYNDVTGNFTYIEYRLGTWTA